MSEENVEVVRRALDAFAANDVEGLLQVVDPEIKFEPHLAMVEGNYKGHDGVREFMTDAFETLRVTGIDHWESRDLGDRVLAVGSFHFYGRESGIEDDVAFAIVAQVSDGQILQLKDYGNKVLALEAAGLSE
jgi:ketosteroid isomerase-like protein